MSTGDFEGLHSSGKGLGIDGTEEDSGSTPLILFEVIRIGWERRMVGDSATRGARVRVELPSNFSVPSDDSLFSEAPNTSDQWPATSIVSPKGVNGIQENGSCHRTLLSCQASFLIPTLS